jgi:hypothetical protein
MQPYMAQELVAERRAELARLAAAQRGGAPGWRRRAGRALVALGLRLGMDRQDGRAQARGLADALLLCRDCA